MALVSSDTGAIFSLVCGSKDPRLVGCVGSPRYFSSTGGIPCQINKIVRTVAFGGTGNFQEAHHQGSVLRGEVRVDTVFCFIVSIPEYGNCAEIVFRLSVILFPSTANTEFCCV